MTTLREAIEQGNLKQFIKENRSKLGDRADFDKVVDAMMQKSSEAHQTSSQDDSDD